MRREVPPGADGVVAAAQSVQILLRPLELALTCDDIAGPSALVHGLVTEARRLLGIYLTKSSPPRATEAVGVVGGVDHRPIRSVGRDALLFGQVGAVITSVGGESEMIDSSYGRQTTQ